jgi:hypothetical protein
MAAREAGLALLVERDREAVALAGRAAGAGAARRVLGIVMDS